MNIRPYEEKDHAQALELLKNGVKVPGNHVIVSDDDGQVDGAVIWLRLGDLGYLGAVTTVSDDRRLFYSLIRACCKDAISTGLKRAEFHVKDPRLVTRIERDFNAVGEIEGRHVDTGEPTSWRFEVDLEDALKQLDEKLA